MDDLGTGGAEGATEERPGAGALHCGQCGSAALPDDRFCRSCGSGLSDSGGSQAPGLGDSPRRFHKRFLAVTAVVCALAAVAAVLLVSGVFDTKQKLVTKASVQQLAAARLDRARARLQPAFTTAMRERALFFIAERSFLAAMADAKDKLGSYHQQYADFQAQNKQISAANQPLYDTCNQAPSYTPCPNPTYPSAPLAPDVSHSASKLRSAASRLGRLRAQVLVESPPSELRTLYAQMTSAIDSLAGDATYNADTLTQAVTAGTNSTDTGNVDDSKAKTLHDESALPAIQQMNDAAISLIKQMKWPLAQYDVATGTDVDPSDHSTAT